METLLFFLQVRVVLFDLEQVVEELFSHVQLGRTGHFSLVVVIQGLLLLLPLSPQPRVVVLAMQSGAAARVLQTVSWDRIGKCLFLAAHHEFGMKQLRGLL